MNIVNSQRDTSYSKIEDTTQPILLLVIILWLATIISQLASLAYTISGTDQDFITVMFQSFIFLSVITLPISWLGIRLGRKIGLGAPLLAALLKRKSGALNVLYKDTFIALLIGLALGGVMVLIRILTVQYLPSEIPAFGFRGLFGGLLVSISAGIGEEVWFRLGLMTLLFWVIMRLLGHEMIRPSVAWPVIIITAFVFGLAHLPQLLSFDAGSHVAIWTTILGNTIVGTFYGWCYWRRSLVAAIIGHFAVDIVIHALPALFI